jgi:hypothetical protein
MRPTKKRREPVEPLDRDMTTTKSTTHRREREAILGRDRIDGGLDPDNVQEPGDFANHRLPIVGAVCGYLITTRPGLSNPVTVRTHPAGRVRRQRRPRNVG